MTIMFSEKNANATLDYPVDFGSVLQTGDAISNVAVLVPDGLTLMSSGHVGNVVTARIGPGGQPGAQYLIEYHASATSHQTYVETRLLPIEMTPPSVWSVVVPISSGSGAPSNGVESFNSRTGQIILTADDVIAALGYVPAATSGDIVSSGVALFDTAIFDQSTFG